MLRARDWWITAAALIGAAAAFALGPWAPRMTDLIVYQAGAQALLDGVDLYTVTDPGTGLPFTYPVFAAMVFVPFAVVPDALARVAITALTLAALLLVTATTLRWRRPEAVAPRSAAVFAVAALAVVSHPVSDTLLFGQINVILLAMVLADVFVVRGRGRGVLVGIAAGIKLTPGLFVLYYLVTGQRREARNAALAGLGTLAVGFILQPGPAWDYLTRHMLDPARTGNVTYAGNQSLLATTARLLRDPLPPAWLTLGLSAVVAVTALVLAYRLDRLGHRLAAVCVVGVATLLASPIAWTHHWVWLVPCLSVYAAWAAGRTPWAWVPFGVAVLAYWTGPMRFMPKNDLRELAHNLPQQLITNSFALLALGFLAWAAYLSRMRDRAQLTVI